MSRGSTNTIHSTVATGSKTLRPPTDRLPQGLPSTLTLRADLQAMPLAAPHDASEAWNTWDEVVGRIKWVLDTLSPVAGVRVIFVLCFLD